MYKYPNKISFFKLLLKSSTITRNPIPFHKEGFDKHGDSFAITPPFGKTIMLTRDAEIIKYMLRKNHRNYNKSKIQTKYLSKYVGKGLLTASGDYWLKQRRLIQPAFHKEKLQKLVSIMEVEIGKQLQAIKEDKKVDVYPIMNELAFHVVAKSLFNYSSDDTTMHRLQEIIEKLQDFIIREIRQPHKKWWYQVSGLTAKHMMLVQESRDIINKVIDERRLSDKEHDDLLDMLLKAKYEEDGTSMTNEQLIDEILIFFVAGHETTANALTFTFHLIAKNTEVLQKVITEVDAIDDNLPPMEKLAKLNYVKMCVEETLRLYPPAWITDRVAIEDDSFEEYNIEKGTMIGISFYELHRNEKYWKNPNDFVPERFSEENRKETAGHYFPFGAGPRMCIGNGFALYEMMLSVCAMLKKYHIETDQSEVKIAPLITLKPIDVTLKFTKRTS
ncbi:Putative cytochrome P450 132 [Kordia antarctica]|uniref:Cytochrome P450 132 n=1 Tax=Kordia antarctica TaxID=1218801 RepID=A0A7L4ZNV0_9FLAO|nr:cytochrome P450 [Kordia antarctica]QHI38171.1 Putative cytochrome P450 132 [Kordia antarctica]